MPTRLSALNSVVRLEASYGVAVTAYRRRPEL
jgi:hypothetical protein